MKTLLIISIILLGIMGAVLLADLIPLFRRWFSRIHIGQWENTKEWENAVEKSLLSQLKKAPAVPVSDNTRFTVIERLRGNYKSKNLQNWQEAALLLGANEMHKRKPIDKPLKEFIDSKINPATGEWRDCSDKADSAMLAYAILSSPYSDKQKIKPAMEQTAKLLLGLSDKYGTIPYNNSLPNVRFIDTVGMICPFLCRYGLEYGCMRAVEAAKKQIEEYIEYGIHKELNLPVHCFDSNSLAPLGIYAWGRGCGWLALGLMDSYLSLSDISISNSTEKSKCLDDEPEEYVNELRSYIMDQMKIFAGALINFQMENGAWARQIFLKDAGESSATAMLAWYMGRMYISTGDNIYKTSAEKAKNFLESSTRLSGQVDYAQGDTKGIGFYSSKIDAMPAAQGFTVRSIF